MNCPISSAVLATQDNVRAAFRSAEPLPQFVVVPKFLRRSLVVDAMRECRGARYTTFCSYSRSAKAMGMQNEFCEPNENFVYLTVHQQPMRALATIVRLRQLFKNKETLDALSRLTGMRLKKLIGTTVLTCWNPGSFLEPHTDFGSTVRPRLTLSLSLTGRWRPSYGGHTVFAWRGTGRAVRLAPRWNTAVLFAPFSGSFHWVEQISENAPPRRRFTWTAFFA